MGKSKTNIQAVVYIIMFSQTSFYLELMAYLRGMDRRDIPRSVFCQFRALHQYSCLKPTIVSFLFSINGPRMDAFMLCVGTLVIKVEVLTSFSKDQILWGVPPGIVICDPTLSTSPLIPVWYFWLELQRVSLRYSLPLVLSKIWFVSL